MKTIPSLLFLLFLALLEPLQAQKPVKIVSAEITFEFVSKKVKGTINGFESQSRIDWNNLENSYFKGSVESKSLDTDNGLRNWSLRSGKYFDVDDYPRITFESTNVQREGDSLMVTGILNIKGNEKEILITFKKKGQQLIGTTSLYSIEYGIKIKKKREENLVNVKMVFDIST